MLMSLYKRPDKGPNLFQEFVNYGVGAARGGMGIAE